MQNNTMESSVVKTRFDKNLIKKKADDLAFELQFTDTDSFLRDILSQMDIK